MFTTRTHHHEGARPRHWRTALRALVGLATVAATVAGPVGTVDAAGPAWLPMGTGLADTNAGTTGSAYATLPVGGLTYVGGFFDEAGGVAVSNIAVWDGAAFHALGDPATDGPTDVVWSLATDGTLIYVGGAFGVMSWDPGTQTWTDLAVPGGAEASALLWYSDGSSSYLVMGGDTVGGVCKLLAYDGGSWSSIATLGVTVASGCAVYALGQYGNQMVVGGQFESINSTPFNSVALWAGATDTWSALDGASGDGVMWGSTVGDVYVIAVDDASGAIYLGGQFDSAGGTATTNLTSWNSGAFIELGGANTQWDANLEEVDALSLGNGQLAVGGYFALDGTQVNVAVLDLSTDQWVPLLGGTDDLVATISINITLAQAYVGGEFTTAYSDTTPTDVADTGGIAIFGDSSTQPQITGVTVTGTATVGRTLTAHATTTGDPAPTVTYQWIRCNTAITLEAAPLDRAAPEVFLPQGCVVITGATRTTYTLVAADIGKHVGVMVQASNTVGAAFNLAVQPVKVAAAPVAPTTTTTTTTVPDFVLPATGGHDTPLAWVALSLVTGGLVLLAVRRRTA